MAPRESNIGRVLQLIDPNNVVARSHFGPPSAGAARTSDIYSN